MPWRNHSPPPPTPYDDEEANTCSVYASDRKSKEDAHGFLH